MLDKEIHDDIVVLRLDDLLQESQNQEIIHEVEQDLEAGRRYFVIDLAPMPYMNSTGLSFLISVLTRARSAGGEVVLANLAEPITKILLITRLQTMFQVVESVDEGIKWLQSQFNPL